MSRRKPMPELDVHPEELMQVAPVSVEGVDWTGIFATRWWFCGVNSGPDYICALAPKGDGPRGDSHRWVNEHIQRIREWLRHNQEPEEIKQRAPVRRLFPRQRRLWEAVLATWNRDQVDMACATYGPLGCFNDDTPGTPFTKERCREICHEQGERHYGSGGARVQEGAAQ